MSWTRNEPLLFTNHDELRVSVRKTAEALRAHGIEWNSSWGRLRQILLTAQALRWRTGKSVKELIQEELLAQKRQRALGLDPSVCVGPATRLLRDSVDLMRQLDHEIAVQKLVGTLAELAQQANETPRERQRRQREEIRAAHVRNPGLPKRELARELTREFGVLISEGLVRKALRENVRT